MQLCSEGWRNKIRLYNTEGFVKRVTAALRCFRLSVCVSSRSSPSSPRSDDVIWTDDCRDGLSHSSCLILRILRWSPSLFSSLRSNLKRLLENGHAILQMYCSTVVQWEDLPDYQRKTSERAVLINDKHVARCYLSAISWYSPKTLWTSLLSNISLYRTS